MLSADQVIKELGLMPLADEGGYYIETFSSPEEFVYSGGSNESATRSLSSVIYYLITEDNFSAMHRLDGTEVFHLYMGGPVESLLLYPGGTGELVTVGIELTAGERPQMVVPCGSWQGTRLKGDAAGFALLGTTMAPGFHIDDFELGFKSELIESYPDFAGVIEELTR